MARKLVGGLLALFLVFAGLGLTATAQASYVRPGTYAYTTDYLNIRYGPGMGYNVKTTIPYHGRVYVRSGPYRGWYRVTYGGSTGWVYGSYLTSSYSSAYSTRYARTTASLNLRAGPGTGYYVKRLIPYGGIVRVYGGPYGGGWYKVSYGGTVGYVSGYYLGRTTSSGSSGSTYSSGSYSSSRRQAIVNTAYRYLGSRYAYYGDTPYEGFSCVGFTQWVYRLNGIYLPENLGGQASRGTPVSVSNLRPGDLVFYQNTFWSGLSHAAIYVGNGYMIGSDNPSWGVHKDYMWSSYWTSRWWGARSLLP